MSTAVMPSVIAHRGACGNAPENTLAAIQLAADYGAGWIEIDVNVSKDLIPVLFHDDGLERCSNGKGLVIEHSLDDLKKLDCGSWFDAAFSGERIATFDECLDLALQLELGINLEIKPCSGWDIPTTDAIAGLLNSRTHLPQIVVSSFSDQALQRAAEKLPHLPRSTLYLVAPPDWAEQAQKVGASNIHLHANSLLTATDVNSYHAAGLGVYCYTVNTPEQAAELKKIGVDGVFSNYPKELLAAGL